MADMEDSRQSVPRPNTPLRLKFRPCLRGQTAGVGRSGWESAFRSLPEIHTPELTGNPSSGVPGKLFRERSPQSFFGNPATPAPGLQLLLKLRLRPSEPPALRPGVLPCRVAGGRRLRFGVKRQSQPP
ncbi:hypothetical protein HJG60_009730 [Phyllostomus discolor]|uniref:Uncharacterized protein n=1 Tax=Phyllostomus discolor TaxID=89673 RepID=A0A834B851_9CHIR|nr:hypothetical protein HJG60_009730 [Phyllostomus discolor]